MKKILVLLMAMFNLNIINCQTVNSTWQDILNSGTDYSSIISTAELFFESNENKTLENGYFEYLGWKQEMLNIISIDDENLFGKFNLMEDIVDYNSFSIPSTNRHPIDWTSSGPNYFPATSHISQTLGEVTAICAISDLEVFIGTANGGIFKTIDGGINWVCLTDQKMQVGSLQKYIGNIGVTDMVIRNDKIYATVGRIDNSGESYNKSYATGFLYSSNKGSSWEFKETPGNFNFNNNTPMKLIVSPDNDDYILIMTKKEIYKSINIGTSWNLAYYHANNGVLNDITLRDNGYSSDDIFFSYTSWKDVNNPNNYQYACVLNINNIWNSNIFNFILQTNTNKPYSYSLEYNNDSDPIKVGLYLGYKYGMSYILNKMDGSQQFNTIYSANFSDNDFSAFTSLFYDLSIIGDHFIVLGGPVEIISCDYGSTPFVYTESMNYNYSESAMRPNSISKSHHYYWIATNGGVSKTIIETIDVPNELPLQPNLDPNYPNTPTYVWKNANGTGLNIGQFNGIAIGRKDKSLIAAGSDNNFLQIRNELGSWELPSNNIFNPNIIFNNKWTSRIGNPVFDRNEDKIYYQGLGFSYHTFGIGVSTNYQPIDYQGTIDIASKSQSFDFDILNNWWTNMPTEVDINNHLYIGSKDVKLVQPSGSRVSICQPCSLSSRIYGVNDIEISENDPTIMWVSHKSFQSYNNSQPTMFEKLFKVTISNSTQSVPTYSFVDVTSYINSGNNQFLSALVNLQVNDIEIEPNNSNIVYVAFGGFGKVVSNVMKQRVFKTIDGGNNWTDISAGLPQVPVNKIFRLPNSSSNEMLVGTDVGVYYYSDQTNGEWQYTNLDANGNMVLPIVPVTDFDFDIESNKVYISTFGRGVYMGQLECISATADKIVTPINNGDNIIISTSSFINRDFEIFSGGTLTINNGAIVGLGDGSKITIHPGGNLIVDNATLTSGCAEKWQGIIIEGQQSLSQIPNTNQGVCVLKNNARIVNAINGAKVNSGGLLFADKTTFLNNEIGVFFYGYKGFQGGLKYVPNRSSIKSSKFLWNNIYTTITTNPIGIFNVADGVNLLGNSFIDYTNKNIEDRAYGICNFGGSYNLNSVIANSITQSIYTQSHFENLYYGISNNPPWVFFPPNKTSTKKTTINDAVFTNCYRSIYDHNNYSIITKNNISVPDYDPSLPLYNITNEAKRSYGIYLDYSKYYKVEENQIKSLNTQSGQFGGTIGVIVNNSYDVNNEIYNNDLNSLNYGLLAMNQNRSYSSANATGLKILCNSFSNNERDIVVSKFPTQATAITGVHPEHKTTIINLIGNHMPAPAHNLFSHNGSTTLPNTDIDNRKASFMRYYFQNGTSSDPWVPVFVNYSPTINGIPTQIGNSINTQYLSINDQSLLCASKLTSSPNTSVLISARSSALQSLNSAKLILAIWENGGIQNLQTEVELTDPWEAYEQFNTLMLESPYLSEQVLVEIVNNQSFTNLMVKLLLLANPQSSTYQSVIDALEERVPSFPDSYLDEIMSDNASLTQYDILSSDVTTLQYTVDDLNTSLKRIYYNDTVNDYSVYLIPLLLSENTLSSRYELAELYFINGDYTAMNGALNNIPVDFELTELQNEDLQNTVEYYSLLIHLEAEEYAIDALTNAEITFINSMIETGNYFYLPGIYTLYGRLNDDYKYEEPIYISSDQLSSRKPKSVFENSSSEANRLNLYPNPASDYVTIDYNIKEEFSKVELIISDVSGREVMRQSLANGLNQNIINLSSLSNGSYLVVIKGDGLILSYSKLTKMDK